MSETWEQWQGQSVNGEFRLVQYLGSSGQNAVFLTERGAEERQKAAIKLVPADATNADAKNEALQLSRWERAKALSHPNLLRIFAAGRCQLGAKPYLFVVMEYAEEDLSQILPYRPLTTAETREMLGPVLNALEYIHGQGLVHAHLKPANIMAISDQIKLSTDGVRAAGEPSENQSAVGSNPYAAPEAAAGNISPASDVWSLGITLVEVLTQHRPTPPGTQADPAIPENLPEPFLDIVKHSLVRNPAARYSLAEIRQRLQQAPALEQTAATPKISPARYGIAAVIAGVILLAILGGKQLLHHSPSAAPAPEAPVASPQQPTTAAPERKPVSASPTAPSKTPSNGEVAKQVLPNVSQSARNTIQGRVKVRVKVKVDPSGDVDDATFDSAGPSKYFARQAMAAAKDWKFTPPQVSGEPVASEWLLRFEFGRTATQAFAKQTKP